ncbi:MAG: hypothetical protein M1829_004656 [Trizodia sp. TS-e1964]|nr:MAG: hypothetical protein M1829_004656 [Trizodia sp. TS-e1964]
MTSLNLSMIPENIGKIHDALVCLAKFSESVFIEVCRNRMSLTALNSSKSAHASFTLDSTQFFSQFDFVPFKLVGAHPGSSREEGRPVDLREKERETAIERCELSIHESSEKVQCRLVVRMFCRHGVLKTYRLTYESCEVAHAIFDKRNSTNNWSISSAILGEFVEHFGPKTELLDFYFEGGKATFTSYTEKVTDGKQILKQPLQTSVAVDTSEFSECSVEDKLHIAISVKDFKAIVAHAECLKSAIWAVYSRPTRPLRLAYTVEGVACNFILMTVGDFASNPVPNASKLSRAAPPRQLSAQPFAASAHNAAVVRPSPALAPPPSSKALPDLRINRKRPASHIATPPRSSIVDPGGLFLTQDDDSRWDEMEITNDNGGEKIGWDASASVASMFASINRGAQDSARLRKDLEPDGESQRIGPTQQTTTVRGIFDD